MSANLTRALEAVAARTDQLLKEAIGVAEIPAPPFKEEARSSHIARRFREVGLQEVAQDQLGNVTGRRPGPAGSPRVMVIAHMDTVFPEGTDVKVRVEGERAYGPGIRDNSSAVSNVISLPAVLDESGLTLPCDLILASSVGEEGLGDLRGVRQLMADWKEKLDAVVVYDGELGSVVHGGVGSKRIRVTYKAPGGHSFGDFGKASAIHALSAACYRFSQIQVPVHPKTTLNVGTFHGGTSVNSIAEQAEAVIDMRSAGAAELEELYAKALKIFTETAPELGSTCSIEVVGDRPGGFISSDHPLVQHCVTIIRSMGREPRLSVGSTDANIPLSLGLPAVCIGGGNGSGIHTLGEYLTTPSLVPGMQQLVRVLAGLDWTLIRG